jgi:predicted pyridoxine 5'-phosphate oxidase superfamily flavin-nucleotide-binding protein
MDDFYHDGNRAMQDSFASRALADRLAGRARRAFSDDDRGFVESAIYFFLATADAQGRPDCSYKGGPLGFVRVIGPSELAFPDYDGNGMFKSLGNLGVNPHVGLLFIDMHGRPRRLRVNGRASVTRDDALRAQTPGAQLIVRVAVDAIFSNCPRYIPQLGMVEASPYTPQAGVAPVEPGWKGFDVFKDVVPPRQDGS